MVSLAVSTGLLVGGIVLGLLVGRRRPPSKPVTWGEAFVGATFVFGLMMLAYGVVPNQWLNYADNELLWRPDKILGAVSSEGVKFGEEAKFLGGRGRILVNYQAVRDIVAAGIYGVGLGANMVLWSKWQKRGQAKPEIEPSSAFGRPVLRKA